MDEKNACATTASRCLAFPEIIYEVASYLHKSQDLLSTSNCCRIWYETLIPLRSKLSCVLLRDITSFRDFLSSNERAAYHCQALHILSEAEEDVDDDDDDEEDRDEEEDNNNDTDEQKEQPENAADLSAIRDILHLLSNNGGLKFFMYAVPGETCTPLSEDIWITLRELSNSLEGLYVEQRAYHWHTFLSSQYSNLQYLHLFLGIDDRPSLSDTSSNPTDTLIAFLHQHKNLQNLHLYLGSQFDEMDLSELYFPNLQSFLLAGDAKVRQFIAKHTTLQHLSVHADSDVKPLTEHDLPNLLSLQVNHLTLPWFQNMLAASSSSRKQPIRNLCVMNPELDLNNVEHIIAPLGRQLRCLELNFGYPNERLISVLEYVSRMSPELVELSLEVPSCMISDEDNAAAVSMSSILECFATSNHLLAISVSSDEKKVFRKDVDTLLTVLPPRLRYLVWNERTFHLEREGHIIKAVRTYHPRSLRGSRYMRHWYLKDWDEAMVYDHVREDYEDYDT